MFGRDTKWPWLLLVPVPVVLVLRHIWKRKVWVRGIQKKAVFITGCDTGFGYEAAKSLHARGVYVYAGCFTESGASKLKQETGDRLKTVILDVSNIESIEKAFQYVKDTLPDDVELWGLVNNAGVAGQNGPLEFLNKDDFVKTFSVNFYGMVETTKAFLPLLKKSKGRVVNTCSIVVELPMPGSLPYTASKWAAKAFSDTLRLESAMWGIKVSVVEPGGYRTSLSSEEGIAKQQRDRWDQLDQQIRDEYGEEYIQGVIDDTVAAWKDNSMFTPDLKPVVGAYEHALFARYPRQVYYPGAEIINFVPKSIIMLLLPKPRLPICLLKT